MVTRTHLSILNLLNTIANVLIIAIQNALRFEEIDNFNQTLQAKIDDATRKLRRTNQRLKELDEAKDDFVSMASPSVADAANIYKKAIRRWYWRGTPARSRQHRGNY